MKRFPSNCGAILEQLYNNFNISKLEQFQGSFRVVSVQFRSNFRADFEENLGKSGAISGQICSSCKTVSIENQSNFGATVSQQLPSDFRAISVPFLAHFGSIFKQLSNAITLKFESGSSRRFAHSHTHKKSTNLT